MSAGDLVNSLGKLESKLKQVKFPNYRRADFLSGTLDIYLAVYGYVFSSFNCEFSKAIAERGLELYGKTNKHFVDNLYRIVRDVLCYKPPITKNMFLIDRAFIEMKMIMCTHILDLVLQKCKEFSTVTRRSSRCKTRILANKSNTNEGPRLRNSINTANEEPTNPVKVSNSSASTLYRLDNNTHFYNQQNATRSHLHKPEHNPEDTQTEKTDKTDYSIKPHLGKKLFHACSALGIPKNYQITQFALPPNSKSRVILEKQKSNIEKIPVRVEIGPFPKKEKTQELFITQNENSNHPSNCVEKQDDHISNTIPKVVRCPLTSTLQNAEKISNSSKEINHDPMMENISETLVKSAKILLDLQQKNLEGMISNSSKMFVGKENSPVLSSLDTEITPVEPQQNAKENFTKNQTCFHPSSVELGITCKKELDYCLAKMNLMECAIKSLESKLENL
ncbi:uncharacterized protein LOC106876223 [Octopus bimaculoides]|uniref:Centrosomal protein of 44 kDa n=1 Tax=Octopus bimaculoides TaxID=37653 RepID=A0A0L8GLQ0_OCTBM|nr:uncharacterized protein LOC106876223 [Octopus bimaculoides]|eukprot:XP_014780183.1 PREDICTED: uncharacterized protein LOC106876223 [Octopus bimaculoides]